MLASPALHYKIVDLCERFWEEIYLLALSEIEPLLPDNQSAVYSLCRLEHPSFCVNICLIFCWLVSVMT